VRELALESLGKKNQRLRGKGGGIQFTGSSNLFGSFGIFSSVSREHVHFRGQKYNQWPATRGERVKTKDNEVGRSGLEVRMLSRNPNLVVERQHH